MGVESFVYRLNKWLEGFSESEREKAKALSEQKRKFSMCIALSTDIKCPFCGAKEEEMDFIKDASHSDMRYIDILCDSCGYCVQELLWDKWIQDGCPERYETNWENLR